MRVLVVCHGNRYRSPLAAALIARARPDWDVRSAACKVEDARAHRAAPPARAAARGRGVDLEEHRSRPVTEADIEWADYVYFMDNGNLGRLLKNWPGHRRKFLPLASLVDEDRIPDPAFMGPGRPREGVWKLIEEAVKVLTTGRV